MCGPLLRLWRCDKIYFSGSNKAVAAKCVFHLWRDQVSGRLASPLPSDSSTFSYTGKRVQELNLSNLCKPHMPWVQRYSRQLVEEMFSVIFFPRLQVVSRHSCLELTDAQHSVILQLLLQAFQHCRDQHCSAVTCTVLTPAFSSVRNLAQLFSDALRIDQPRDVTSDIHTSIVLVP